MFEKIACYESYAILREPRERFAAALLHYLRTEQPTNSWQSLARFQQAARDICAEIEKAGDKPIFFMLFQRQTRFVMLDGHKLVRNLYRFDELERFATDLRAQHGILLDLSLPYNMAQFEDGAMLQCIKELVRPLARQFSPNRLRWMRSKLRKATRRSTTRLYAELYADDRIGAFVDHFYAEDIALYQSISKDGGSASIGYAGGSKRDQIQCQ